MLLRQIAAGALLIAACAAPQLDTTAALIDTLPGGIVRVMNSGPAEWADTNGWHLVLDHVVQPSEGAPGELGSPGDIALHPDGSLLTTEQDPVEVKLFAPDGTFERSIGRDGSGPGEFRRAEPAWLGDTVVVQDNSGRANLYTRADSFIRSFATVCCVGGIPIGADDAGRIRVTGMRPGSMKAFDYQWIWINSLGERVDSMPYPNAGEVRAWLIDQGGGGVASYSIPFAPYTVSAFFRDGRIVYGFSETYQIAVTRRSGDSTLVFGRTNTVGVPIADSLRDAMWEMYNKMGKLPTSASKDDLARTYQTWGTLHEDAAGNVWVGRMGAKGAESFDVFTRDGVLRGTVPAPWVDASSQPWVRTSWGGDRVAVLDTDANDLPRIRVYRVAR